MNKLFFLLAVGMLITGCSTEPKPVVQTATSYTQLPPYQQPQQTVYKLRNYDGPEAMDPNEVLDASRQCIMAKMHPNVSYLSVRTEAGKVRVPVSVMCEPY